MRKKLSLLALTMITGAVVLPQVASAADEELLVSTNDPMAAFLETRAYAAKMGATAEFRKMEGVAYDKVNNKIYIAMSSIDKTMSDDKGAIKLPENKCGIVYEAKLDAGMNISTPSPPTAQASPTSATSTMWPTPTACTSTARAICGSPRTPTSTPTTCCGNGTARPSAASPPPPPAPRSPASAP